MSLTIQIHVGTSCQIKFLGQDGELLLSVKSPLSTIQLSELRAELRQGLNELWDAFVHVNQKNIEYAVSSLAKFHGTGRYVLQKLFDHNQEKLDKASRICRKSCFGFEEAKDVIEKVPLPWHPKGWVPRLIAVESALENGIAIELLPILNYLPPIPSANEDGLGRLARDFLGFSAIVHRMTPCQHPVKLKNVPALPVRLFTNGELPGASSIRKFFKQEEQYLQVEQEWPDEQTSSTPPAFELARLLWSHSTDKQGGKLSQPVQMLHFACHCDAVEQPSKPVLRFKCDPQQFLVKPHLLYNIFFEKKVTAKALEKAIMDLRSTSWVGGDKETRPLVFLNACGSGDFDPTALSTFPDIFFKTGFLGFIGTQTVVPDAFASWFSQSFYESVLAGTKIGTALYDARWQMLEVYKNPLGLIYFLYADPNIAVAKPIRPKKRVNMSTIGV